MIEMLVAPDGREVERPTRHQLQEPYLHLKEELLRRGWRVEYRCVDEENDDDTKE